MEPGPGSGYVTTIAGLAKETFGDLTRTLVPAETFTTARNVPDLPVCFVPPTFTQCLPRRRWMTYGLRPEPGRTWPQSTVRDPLRDISASGSANAARAGFALPDVV